MPSLRLQNNSSFSSNSSKLANIEKIRVGVTQFLQPGGNIQSIRYPKYTDIKVGTFVNAKMVLAIDAETEELLFRSITGKSKDPNGFTHPGILPNNQ